MRCRRAFFLLILPVGACQDPVETLTSRPIAPRNELVRRDHIGSMSSTTNLLPDPPAPRPAPPIGGLRPLSRAVIERELVSSVRCALDDQAEGILLVAVSGNAIVHDGGRIVHLKPEKNNLEGLMRGGRFIGDELVVEIDREHQVERTVTATT